MSFDPSVLAMLLGISVLANAIIEALITPIFEKYNLDKFWLMYIAWVVAGVLTFLGGINLFEAVFASPMVGLVLTAIIAGRASNILHDLTDKQDDLLPVFNMLEEDDEAEG